MTLQKQLVVRIHEDLDDRIAAVAENLRKKKSVIIRRALERGIAAMTPAITRRRRPAALEPEDFNR